MHPPQALVCPTCSAPLGEPDVQGFARCRFCGATVEPASTFAPPLPPPPPPMLPMQIHIEPFGGRNVQVQVAARANRAAMWIALGVVAFTVFPAIVIGAVTASSASRRAMAVTGATTLPAVCGFNDSLTLSGVSYTGGGTAITASANCTLTLLDSNVSAGTAIRVVGPNVQVSLVRTSLKGSSDAVVLGDNAHLMADPGTTITSSTGAAITGGGGSTEIDLDHTNVTGQSAGLDLADNVKVFVRGATVKGAAAIRARLNATLVLSDHATIAGGATGLSLQSNANVSLEDATVQATGEAIEVGSGATLDGHNCRVVGGAAYLATHGSISRNDLACAVSGPHLVDGHPAAPAAPPPPQHPVLHPQPLRPPPFSNGRRY